MTSPTPVEPEDLLDLKLLPSWLQETAPTPNYEHYEGGDTGERGRPLGPRRGGPDRDRRRERRPSDRFGGRDRGPGRDRKREERPARGEQRRDRGPKGARGPRGERPPHPRDQAQQKREAQDKVVQQLAERVTVRFLPHPPVLENVVAQIKLNPVAYSVFALARLFLGKPERYDVKLVVKGEAPLFQLGEQGAISADREFLESNAFRLAQGDFYKTEVVQGEPIKGNFNSVARERSGGILLGPTNHHAYQPKLRALYEQRFSRRMSFPEFQRQIEIVADPAVVEQWKEEARNTTTWSTLKEETPASFTNPNETERHFRQHYLSNLVRAMTEGTVDGVTSRQMADRYLRRLVENSWARETRSPSQMMQELSARLRDAGLQIFRHRKGMLFVSTVRPRPFAHEQSGVSAQVRAILELVAANPGINRKDFADKILGEVPESEAEARKLSLASDLHWLISEGYVIEFNDGSLDLPRVKQPKPAEGGERKAETAAPSESAQSAETAVPTEDQREVKPNDIAETVPATVSLQDQPSVESVDASGDAQSPVIPSEVEGSRGETEQ